MPSQAQCLEALASALELMQRGMARYEQAEQALLASCREAKADCVRGIGLVRLNLKSLVCLA